MPAIIRPTRSIILSIKNPKTRMLISTGTKSNLSFLTVLKIYWNDSETILKLLIRNSSKQIIMPCLQRKLNCRKPINLPKKKSQIWTGNYPISGNISVRNRLQNRVLIKSRNKAYNMVRASSVEPAFNEVILKSL